MKMAHKVVLACLMLSLLAQTFLIGTRPAAHAAESADYTLDELSELLGYEYMQTRYETYIEQYQDKKRPNVEIVIDADQFTLTDSMQVNILEDYEGMSGKSVYTEEFGVIEWEVDIPEAGLYNISIDYYPVEGKSSAIQRSLLINGDLPFAEAANLEFKRVWINAQDTYITDNRGNELRPRQIEAPRWQNAIFEDNQGYYTEPFLFWFDKGVNTITLYSQREPMVIRRLIIHQQEPARSYSEVRAQYQALGYQETSGHLIQIQGEDAAFKSEPTLYPFTDRSTYLVEPFEYGRLRINAIGGYNWRLPGETITWEVEVPEAGLYQLGFKAKQRYIRGLNSYRKLSINGEVPFSEVEDVRFAFSTDYEMHVISDASGEPYLFYLQEGTNTITMEAVLGDIAPIIRTVEMATLELTDIYRKILMITGAEPDPYRDYQLEKKIPNLLDDFAYYEQVLRDAAEEFTAINGQQNQQTAILITMADQLASLIKKPYNISKSLTSMRMNLSALGTFILTVREQPLDVDYFVVASPDVQMPVVKSNFFLRMIYEVVSFFYSFIIDYNTIGNTIEDEDSARMIEVWTTSGRDQAQIIKQLADDYFTPQTGISVKLRLVQGGTLLPATLVGTGPDVALNVGNDIPVNYAMRSAVYDLTNFEDFGEVAARFRPSALEPYQYDGGVYALPETQRFNVLFYRKDILDELGLEVPQTWDDVFNMLSVLAKNNMEFGLPQPGTHFGQQYVANLQPNSMYALLLYQHGGEFYVDDGKASGLDSEEAMKAFQIWTEFYTHYSLPVEFQFANRFRTGEMPVAIEDYTNYNLLQVFAPELRGLWGFAPVPGTVQEDGTIRRDVASTGEGAIIMNAARDKEAAWAFLKWWTSEEIQLQFGREMEALMGAAARWPTANIAAFEKLPWPTEDFRQLEEGFAWVRGIPEVPGGYFTGRHVENAFWKVRHQKYNPREALEEYVELINSEITQKRQEFGLPN